MRRRVPSSSRPAGTAPALQKPDVRGLVDTTSIVCLAGGKPSAVGRALHSMAGHDYILLFKKNKKKQTQFHVINKLV